MRTKKSNRQGEKLASSANTDITLRKRRAARKHETSPAVNTRNKRTKLSDEQLANLIGANARLSSEKLAKKLNVSPTTIRRHIKTATRKGIMRVVAVVDPDKAGLSIQAVLGFRVARENVTVTINALEKLSEIKWLATITGGYDIMARAAFTSVNELSIFMREKIGNIKGIDNAESFICLNTPKGRFISLD